MALMGSSGVQAGVKGANHGKRLFSHTRRIGLLENLSR